MVLILDNMENLNFNKSVIVFFTLLTTFFTFASCGDKEDYDYQERKEYNVKYNVTCNNPTAHIKIWDGRDTPQIAIGKWETSFSTKSYATELTVTCQEDKKATITIQLYINNKLIREVSGFQPVELHYRLK